MERLERSQCWGWVVVCAVVLCVQFGCSQDEASVVGSESSGGVSSVVEVGEVAKTVGLVGGAGEAEELGGAGSVDVDEKAGPVAVAVVPQPVRKRPVVEGCRFVNAAAPAGRLTLEVMFGGRTFDGAVDAVEHPTERGVWFVLERSGRIVRVDEGQKRGGKPLEVLRIVGRRVGAPAHGGLLGMAFAPDFESTRHVYLFFTMVDGRGLVSRVARFTMTDQGVLDRKSEFVVLDIPQESNIHKGGRLQFDRAGMLMISVGDDVFDDPLHRAQDAGSLLGKILRIDVRGGTAEAPYRVPSDNPFVGRKGARGEVWALGLRNPWRFNLDAETGAMWAADVGHRKIEEVDVVVAGGNYGWPYKEGTRCNRPRNQAACDRADFLPPVYEYTHREGQSVTGGFVYRGDGVDGLQGVYLFADFVSGVIWGLHDETKEQFRGEPRSLVRRGVRRETLLKTSTNPASIVADRDGEPVVVDFGSTDFEAPVSRLWRLKRSTKAQESDVPKLLSQTGCMDAKVLGEAKEGFIPYQMNQGFWSDGAVKKRWFTVPEGSSVTLEEDGDWSLPEGSVAVKHFTLGGLHVETRFMVHFRGGGWRGFSYAWGPDQKDAKLVTKDMFRFVQGTKWIYPSPAQCMGCHTRAAGRSLGLEMAQLKAEIQLSGGETIEQTQWFQEMGVLRGDQEWSGRVVRGRGEAQEHLSDVVRDYLHTNCAMCHRPGSMTQVGIDLRRGTPLESMGVLNRAPSFLVPGYIGHDLVRGGDPNRSILWHRMKWRTGHGMPPMGSSRVDREGLELVSRWVRTLPKP